jgi:methionine-S-sulfoxide reductase
MKEKYKFAIFAGGCFWCMQGPFDALKGVIDTDAGYCGGNDLNPSYEAVASGLTDHREVVRVAYDPSIVSYKEILEVFWRNIDPTQESGQFYDIGNQYKTAIYYSDQDQKQEAEVSKLELEKSGKFSKDIVTEILKVTTFYKAENYHQDYYLKNPSHYNSYKRGSGRESFIEKTWKKKEN